MQGALRSFSVVKNVPARIWVVLACALSVAPLLAAGPVGESRSVRVLVASSLQPLFERLRPVIEKISGRRMELIGAASSVLARQIRQGFSADVLFSAEKKWAAVDSRGGRSQLAAPRLWMTDEMVLFKREMKEKRKEVARRHRVALGEPLTVPLGAAAQKLLPLVAGQIGADHQVVFGNSALAVIRYVEAGAADFGFATRSLVQHRKGLRVVESFGDTPAGRVQYWISVLEPASFSDRLKCQADSGRVQTACGSEWDHLFFGEEVEQAAKDWGLTSVPSQEITDHGHQEH